MFSKKPNKDCKDLLNINHDIVGNIFRHKFLNSINYSYPSHKDKSVMDRIYAQKKLIEEGSLFEVVYCLAGDSAFGSEYVKLKNSIIQDIPHWSNKRNFSQSSTEFILDGYSYIAERHSSNFNCLVSLYKSFELVFSATLIANNREKGSGIFISSSMLGGDEVVRLSALANLSGDKEKIREDAEFKEFMSYVEQAHEEKIRNSF